MLFICEYSGQNLFLILMISNEVLRDQIFDHTNPLFAPDIWKTLKCLFNSICTCFDSNMKYDFQRLMTNLVIHESLD